MAIVKSKLLKQLKKNWPNLTLSQLNKFTEIILSEIKKALRRNPKTGEKVAVPAKKVISWKMSKEIFKKINNEE